MFSDEAVLERIKDLFILQKALTDLCHKAEETMFIVKKLRKQNEEQLFEEWNKVNSYIGGQDENSGLHSVPCDIRMSEEEVLSH